MDDLIVLGCIVYLFLASVVISQLPSDLFASGTTATYSEWGSPLKIVAFLFVPFVLDGLPAFVGSLVALLNYSCMFIGGLFVYNLIRGR